MDFFRARRKGDEAAAAMPMAVIGVLVTFIALLAAYVIFSPVVNKILVPIATNAINCIQAKGVGCLIEGAASSLGG